MKSRFPLNISGYHTALLVLLGSVMLMLLLILSLDGTPTRAANIRQRLTTASPFPTFTLTATFTPTIDGTLTPTSTGTITATFTPTGTLTAIPRVLIQVIADVGYFRTGPSRAFPVIASVKKLGKIELSGISTDGLWYMFKYGQKAKANTWISADKTITTILLGDPKLLPVIQSPPTPMPRTPSASADDQVYYNPLACVFYSWMSEEAQDQMVQQLQNSINANDWKAAGSVARQLYRCPVDATFYLLYTQDMPAKQASGTPMIDWWTALNAFTLGWNGQ
jgi:hypothetical protein